MARLPSQFRIALLFAMAFAMPLPAVTAGCGSTTSAGPTSDAATSPPDGALDAANALDAGVPDAAPDGGQSTDGASADAGPACPSYGDALPRLEVTAFGAKGDGVADDVSAIDAAVAELAKNGGGTLYFPTGSYRIGYSASGHDGIALVGISNATIEFAQGAVLLMDNLNPSCAGASGHGVHVMGPASNVTLRGVHVEWKSLSNARANGDAFRIEGHPSDPSKALGHVCMERCVAMNSPQVGAIFQGVAYPAVTDFVVENTLADGLHFNACHDVTVDGVTGIGTGDDTLAFVTYYDPTQVASNDGWGPYSQPSLGAWSNTNSTARRVRAYRGKADGVRVSGASNVTISDVEVAETWVGVIVDSATVDASHAWTYEASRGIKLSSVKVAGADTALQIINWNSPSSSADDWSRFDVHASDLDLAGSGSFTDDFFLGTWSTSYVLAGVTLDGVRTSGKSTLGSSSRIQNARDCTVANAQLWDAPLNVVGSQNITQQNVTTPAPPAQVATFDATDPNACAPTCDPGTTCIFGVCAKSSAQACK